MFSILVYAQKFNADYKNKYFFLRIIPAILNFVCDAITFIYAVVWPKSTRTQ